MTRVELPFARSSRRSTYRNTIEGRPTPGETATSRCVYTYIRTPVCILQILTVFLCNFAARRKAKQRDWSFRNLCPARRIAVRRAKQSGRTICFTHCILHSSFTLPALFISHDFPKSRRSAAASLSFYVYYVPRMSLATTPGF